MLPYPPCRSGQLHAAAAGGPIGPGSHQPVRTPQPRPAHLRRSGDLQNNVLCAVDVDNEAVRQTLSLEQFSSLPYLATTCERGKTAAEEQLDRLGISRNVEFSTTFGMVPTLLSGSRMIALVHERLARALADQTALRLLEPPMPLQPIHLLMLWTSSAETDSGRSWLAPPTDPVPHRRTRWGHRPGPVVRPFPHPHSAQRLRPTDRRCRLIRRGPGTSCVDCGPKNSLLVAPADRRWPGPNVPLPGTGTS